MDPLVGDGADRCIQAPTVGQPDVHRAALDTDSDGGGRIAPHGEDARPAGRETGLVLEPFDGEITGAHGPITAARDGHVLVRTVEGQAAAVGGVPDAGEREDCRGNHGCSERETTFHAGQCISAGRDFGGVSPRRGVRPPCGAWHPVAQQPHARGASHPHRRSRRDSPVPRLLGRASR